MTAKEWEDRIRKVAEVGLKNLKEIERSHNTEVVLWSDKESLEARLEFIVDSKIFTFEEIQRIKIVWDELDRAQTVTEVIKFRQRYGR